MQDDLLKLENEFAQAIVRNDAEAVARFLADDWVIIDPDGAIITRAQFLGAIKTGALTHEMMESEEFTVRIYADAAVVVGLTVTKGKFLGQEFATRDRATDIFINQNGKWLCVFSQLTHFGQK